MRRAYRGDSRRAGYGTPFGSKTGLSKDGFVAFSNNGFQNSASSFQVRYSIAGFDLVYAPDGVPLSVLLTCLQYDVC